MDTAEVLVSLLLVAVVVVSLLSNVLVLVCFLYNPEIRKQVPALFTLNLTFCNLLTTVSNMPLTLVGLVNKAQPGGDGFCRTAGFLETFLATNSMLSMAALSMDRWIAVVFPLSYHSKMRHRDAALVLGYTWVHSLSFATVAAGLSWVGYHQLYASCTLRNARAGLSPHGRTQFVIFTLSFHSLTFLLSFVVLCVTYLKVLKVARFHCKRIDVITMQTLVLLVDIHPRILELFPTVPINQHWAVVSKCLAYSKAACDPFVYSLLRHQYRKTYSDIINRLLKRSSLNSSGRDRQIRASSIIQTVE
ncbi:G-protein coupled receptor 26-like isoform X2 [Denticeps clupeoides]|uniref:G-protein coupled receptor 26-like isoform X2 n=1 Tax=Denticeps clupeoides TaxID=299321 RepID=UPI0010A44DB6|nr:G-protein coupled receptor 26 isoform X2 [Denticeps clupeoides]